MTDLRNPLNYPINPTFGPGIYRRRIRLVQHEGYVTGDLEDCNHGFSVSIKHDGHKVTAVEGQHHRIPFTTCGGAITPLQQLVGINITLTLHELSASMNTRANCTHWLDLSLLAIRHILCSETVREYNIEIPDELDNPTCARVYRNNALVHEWLVKDWMISAPTPLANNTLFKGFSAWANTAFADEDNKEAAFILQKGYFVSRARRFDLDALVGESAATQPMMAGACFSYSEPQASTAIRTVNATRDFTHTAEELLLFK